MKPERFTEEAQEALGASQEVVRRYHHSQWDVEHLLLSLLEQEEGIPRDILQVLGADIDAARNRVGATLGALPKLTYDAGQIYATPRIAAILQDANSEADKLKDELVSTEHLLIAIVAQTRGEAATILTELGVTQEKVYQALQKIRGGHRVTDRQAESNQRVLDKYGYDLTQMTTQGKLAPATGKGHEINQLIEALAKKTKSPLLIGDATVDKFSIVQGLAQRIVSGDVPTFLQGKKIVALDLGKLVAGAKFRGEFEERVAAVLDAVRRSEGTTIPYFDELWVGASEGGLDIGSMLKLPLAVGEFQCIAATVPQYLDYFRARGLLAREFEIISVGKTESPP